MLESVFLFARSVVYRVPPIVASCVGLHTQNKHLCGRERENLMEGT